MLKVRRFTLITLLAVLAISAGVIYAQDDAGGDSNLPPVGLRGICRPDDTPGTPLADAFGMTIDEIRDYIRSGGTIAQLAEEKGVDLEAMAAEHKAERLSELESCLTQAVADGDITQTQADTILEHARNFEGPVGPFAGRGFGRHDGMGLFGNRDEGERPFFGPRGHGFGNNNEEGGRGFFGNRNNQG